MTDRRRCLVVAPVFPPSGLPPAHRARLFVRHLAEFGWDPVVVTFDPRDREEPPEAALVATIPANVPVELARAWPASATRRLGIGDIMLRGFVGLGRRAIAAGRAHGVHAVLLVVPPWYGLLLAPWFKHGLRVPIVVDYLDPWDVGAPPHRGKRALAAWVAAVAEGPSLASVDGVFAVSQGIVDGIVTRFPRFERRPRGFAGYGFESSDFDLMTRTASGEMETRSVEPRVVRLVYVGAVSESQQVVMGALLDAMRLIRAEGGGGGVQLRLECYGTSYARAGQAIPVVSELAKARGLADCVFETAVRVPYVEALARLASSDANVVIGDLTTYYAASKLMPVIASGRPLLAILRVGTEPAMLLQAVRAPGLVVFGDANSPMPVDAVPAVACILRQLMQRQIPALDSSVLENDHFRMRSAAQMTGALARVLDAVVA